MPRLASPRSGRQRSTKRGACGRLCGPLPSETASGGFPGPDLGGRDVSGPLMRFGAYRRSGVPNAIRRRALCRLRATLAAENDVLGFLCRNGGVERSAGVPRFAPLESPAGRTAVSRGDARAGGETRSPSGIRRGRAEAPRAPPRARRPDGSAEPSGEHPVRDRHGGGHDRGAARQGPPEAGPGAGVRSPRLVQREPQREEAEERERADPDDCRKRCGREREGEVVGVSSSAHGDEWTAAVRHLLQIAGRRQDCPRRCPATWPDSDLPGRLAGRRETPEPGAEMTRGRPLERSRPRRHARVQATTRGTWTTTPRPPSAGADRVGFLDRIGFRYHHGGRRDRPQRTGNTWGPPVNPARTACGVSPRRRADHRSVCRHWGRNPAAAADTIRHASSVGTGPLRAARTSARRPASAASSTVRPTRSSIS